MTFHQLYKISAFGDYVDIEPSSENMVFLLQAFEEYNMVTSLYQELPFIQPYEVLTTQIAPLIPQTFPEQQRISLLTTDRHEQITIGTSRVDYAIVINDAVGLKRTHFHDYNMKTCKALNIIFEHFNKKSYRLALFTQSIISSSDDEQVEFFKKYNNPISIYKERVPQEWSLRSGIRCDINVNEAIEEINAITNISKSNFSRVQGEELLRMDGFSIDIDINTLAENTSSRFSGGALQSFADAALGIWDDIWSDLS